MNQSSRATGDLRIQLLRGFELTVGTKPVPLTPASERLVAFLAMQERSVRRGFVSGSLWPDVTTERASANLRSALWRVPIVDRRPLVQATATHLGLQPGVCVDFRTAVPLATALVHTGEVELSEEGLALLESDLLPDWCEDWLVLDRERYRQLRLHALDEACASLIRRCRYGQAMVIAMGAIASDPLRESGFRFAVEIHLAEGNLIEAVQQYRAYADRLRAELGAQPSAIMRGLLEGRGLLERTGSVERTGAAT